MLKTDLNIIPIGNGINVIYAPLYGIAFYASDKASDICRLYIKGEKIVVTAENRYLLEQLSSLENKQIKKPNQRSIETNSHLVIILSQMCNLSCSYCYAQESRSKDVLSKEQLKCAIDHIFSKKSKKKYFSFIGGGEPTVTWELLAWAIAYIRQCDNQAGIGITTNGTLLNEERIDLLKEHHIKVNLSFEILPEVQNFQRCFADLKIKSFEIVNRAINLMNSKGIDLSFRSTITMLNVDKMTEMVDFVIKNYPTVNKIHFEPVTSIDNNKLFYDAFIEQFLKSRAIASKYGLDVYCSVSRSFNKLKTRFCRGEFCITPTGEFVSCHRISTKESDAFETFCYARLENGSVLIDEDKKTKVELMYNSINEHCTSCFARWHCAGSCVMERATLPNEMIDLKCYFIKKLIVSLIVEKLNQTIKNNEVAK